MTAIKPYHIVFTTIYHPSVLNDLYANIQRFNHLESVKIWVIGNKKNTIELWRTRKIHFR